MSILIDEKTKLKSLDEIKNIESYITNTLDNSTIKL